MTTKQAAWKANGYWTRNSNSVGPSQNADTELRVNIFSSVDRGTDQQNDYQEREHDCISVYVNGVDT